MSHAYVPPRQGASYEYRLIAERYRRRLFAAAENSEDRFMHGAALTLPARFYARRKSQREYFRHASSAATLDYAEAKCSPLPAHAGKPLTLKCESPEADFTLR